MPKIIIGCTNTDLILTMNTTARSAQISACLIDNNTALRIVTENMVAFDNWVSKYESNPAVSFTRPPNSYIFKPYVKQGNNKLIANNTLTPAGFGGTPYFTANQLATIYNFPPPNPATKVVVGVLSFGGGLYGSVDSKGVLTGGDVQTYWTSIGMTPAQMPRVIIVPVGGATNNPAAGDGGATYENTLDVETIGACCPSANLTIILYIAPNALTQFVQLFTYVLNTPVVVNNVSYTPSILSISWGAPESYFSTTDLTAINRLLTSANTNGINISAATGDLGSNDGVGGTRAYCDFPSSCPSVTAVGGTTLTCPDNVYNNRTVETAWSNGGGGISIKFPKPSYQVGIVAGGRATPDIALNADPNTGVAFIVNNANIVLGGTSVSSALFAAFLAITNTKVFINPKLYTAGLSSYHDIATGTNGQYKARTGYDNCTGLGSINALTLFNTFSHILATSLTLSVQTLTLTVGQVTGINYSLQPPNVSLTSVAWSSNNTNIVSVNSLGVVTAVSVGTATITCTTIDNSNISVTVPVSVNTIVRVASVVLPPVPSIHTGSNIQLYPVITPNNATNKNVTWLSSNAAVATVSNTGLVSGLTFGTSQITCTSIDGNIRATVQVSVTIAAQTIAVAPRTLAMRVGQTAPLTVTVGPPNATNKTVTWSSANTRIALVNTGAVVIAARAGTTIISATSVDTGIVDSCVVTIT